MRKNVNLTKKGFLSKKEENLVWNVIILSILIGAGYTVLNLVMQLLSFQASFSIGLPH